MASYDIIGNIALAKFSRETKSSEKKKFASQFLREHKSVRTVLEKTGKIKGRLRTPTTKFIAGENTKEAIYRESNCTFRLNVDSCYFSPRLSNDRLDVSRLVRHGEKILVMFGGVAPYPIVIAKNSRARSVVSVELGQECCKYAEINVLKNKLEDRIRIIQGDVKKVVPKLKLPSRGFFRRKGFDRIIMSRPNLKDSFLETAFPAIRKKGIIHYHGFYEESKLEDLKNLIFSEAKKAGRKIKILQIKKAGEIGVKKFRYRADIKVLN